ncbi:MAG: LptA/OstA family protein [Opitutales bacterium]
MKLLIYITLFLSSLSLFAKLDSKIIPGNAKGFEISKWDDDTSFLEWKIYGDEGEYKENDLILIHNMKLDIYDGSEKEIEKIKINSELAEVYASTKSAGGDGEIFAKGDNFDFKGRTWLWESRNKKISIYNSLTINLQSKDGDSECVAKSKIGYFFHLKDENIFELERNVNIVDEKSEIDCDYLLLKTDKDSVRGNNKSARSVDAKGNVKILWDKKISAYADKLDIDPETEFAILSGNAKLIDLKSNTQVFGAKIDLNKNSKQSKVYSDKNQRAKAILKQKNDKGELEEVNIYANNISMIMRDEEVEVSFTGNVILETQDIHASCDTMISLATKAEGKDDFELLKVVGEGKVGVRQGKRTASAKTFIYTPETSEIVLNENATMQDEERGVSLIAYSVVLDKNENRAIAISEIGNDKSFVHLRISEIKSDTLKTKSELNIFSRHLITNRDGDNITFNFENDVKIKASNIQASCQRMNIYAKGNQKGRSQISKIEAFENIIIKQEQYLATAQIARIFPNAQLNDAGALKDKSYTELLTSDKKPEERPKIILAPIGNIGLNEKITEGKVYKNTEITSDKQSLVEGEEFDTYFFEGNVEIDSTDMQANCNKIEVKMAKEGDASVKKISHIIATEDVIITQGLKEAKAGRCDIFPNEEMISLSESPVVLDKGNNSSATGYRMTYRKGKKGISIEGDPNAKASTDGEAKSDDGAKKPSRPTITLPPIKGASR